MQGAVRQSKDSLTFTFEESGHYEVRTLANRCCVLGGMGKGHWMWLVACDSLAPTETGASAELATYWVWLVSCGWFTGPADVADSEAFRLGRPLNGPPSWTSQYFTTAAAPVSRRSHLSSTKLEIG